MNEETSCKLFASSFSQSILKVIQIKDTENSISISILLLNSIFPSLIYYLAPPPTSNNIIDNDEVEITIINIIFYALNLINEKEKLLKVILPTICDVLLKRNMNSKINLFIGKGITLLARIYSDIFKQSIVLLSDTQRLLLQEVMKNEIHQSQNNNFNASAQSNNNNNSFKKIDITRYKK
jgi:hypothetical protein